MKIAHSLRLQVVHQTQDKGWVGDETCISLKDMIQVYSDTKERLLQKGKNIEDYTFTAVMFPDVGG